MKYASGRGGRPKRPFHRNDEKEIPLKKLQNMKKRLKLTKEALLLLSQPDLQKVIGGLSNDSCFPDICQEKDSSAC